MLGSNQKRKGSIRKHLILMNALFAIIPLLIVNIISSVQSVKVMEQNSSKLTTEMVKQTCANLDYFSGDIEKNINKCIVNNLNNSSDNLINTYMHSKDVITQTVAFVNIKNQLVSISALENSMDSLAIVTEEGKIIGKLNNLSNEELSTVKDIGCEDNKGIWLLDIAGKDGVYYIKNIQNTITGEKFGKIVIKVNMKSLNEQLGDVVLFKGANISIVDQEGNIVLSSDSNLRILQNRTKDYIKSANGAKNGSEMVDDCLIAYAIGENGWKVVSEIPKSALTSDLKRVTTLVWCLIAVVIVAAIGIGGIAANSITKSIVELMKLMKRAEQGDLTVAVNIKRQDELGMLGDSFNHMICNIRELILETKQVVVETLEAGEVLRQSSDHSVETFGQLVFSIDGITNGSNAQAENMQNTTMAMEHLSKSIQEVIQNTEEIYNNTQGARNIINEAADSMESLNQTMADSTAVIRNIREGIEILNKKTKSIEQIMALVDGISEETNLLALNASIEAARAGDLGKGFAVVAKEVKKLAEESQKSTSHVRETLNDIESKTSSCVKLAENAKSIFENQAQAVEKTYHAFTTIIEILKKIDMQLGVVNEKTSHMASLKNEMSQKMENIATTTAENASATQAVNNLSLEQKAMMNKLRNLAEKLSESVTILEKTIHNFNIR
ncbi:methyl-accepting chemotaxis protein [Cellulosilyticum ruminicola]|uniref:methyl-accepting chemotaxis protein n=1 Tax=Cellulosilyticum ruminicola TaxID=425254 RepID=UPI0006D124D3|nr:methyl-accepting chemotaxis protein [Cellulosilyticum ruminicola]